MVSLINYSDLEFKQASKHQLMTFIHRGGKDCQAYSYEDLSESFKLRHADTLKMSRGAGYWIWKPEIIKKRLSQLNSHGSVLYLDSGISINCDVETIERSLTGDKIVVWRIASDGDELKKWCHPHVLNTFAADENLGDFRLVVAGAILVPKNAMTLFLLDKWQEYCSDSTLLYPELFFPECTSEEYVWHRHDTTLLTILAYKFPEYFDIRTYSDFQSLFILHRKKKVTYVFFSLKINFLIPIKNEIINFLPKILTRKLRYLKFLKIAKQRNLTLNEIKNHKNIY
jgi:hypothetical protein